MTETLHINVGGMTCAACQSHVQRALEETPGVEKAAVNLMTGEATVVFDPHTVAQPAALLDAIRETGYEAELPTRRATALSKNRKSANGRRSRRRASSPSRRSSAWRWAQSRWAFDEVMRRSRAAVRCCWRSSRVRDGVGGAAHFRGSVESRAPRLGRYEYAGGARHRRGVCVFCRRHARARDFSARAESRPTFTTKPRS